MNNTRRKQATSNRNITIYFLIWILTSIGGGVFLYNIFSSLMLKEINITKEIATREVLSVNSFCQSILTSTENNLKLVSNGQYLTNYINTMQPYQIEDTERNERKDFVQFLTQLLSVNTRYNSIRFISVDGRERIKVENTEKGPRSYPPTELNNISQYSYVDDCLKTPKGSIYYSNINLQHKDMNIEFPFKPTLRIGTSIYGRNNKLKGIVIINLGINFSFPPYVSLLSMNGDWVVGGGENWMNFAFGKPDNFATLYPKVWHSISTKEFGSYEEHGTIYEFTTLTPPSSDDSIYWKIVSSRQVLSSTGSTHIVDSRPLILLFIVYEAILISILIFSFKRQQKLYNYQRITETNLEHYDISLKAGHAMSWIYTPDTHSFKCSKHVEDLIGIPADHITNEKDFIELFQKSSNESVKDFFDFLNSRNYSEYQNEISIEHKVQLPTKKSNYPNKELWLKTYAIRLNAFEDRGTIYGISIDITNRVLLEQSAINSRKASEQLSLELQNLLDESERLRIKAEKASSAKADFLANMSHEIRTPMNSVLGMVSLLHETELTSEQKDYITAIKYSGETLLMIINDILDHSKIESGKLEITEVPFNLTHMIEHIVEMISPQAEVKSVALTYDIDDNISESLIGDDLRITQILLNLGGNAVKFTSTGSINFSVKLLEDTEAISTVEIRVTDTGIGIAKDALENIFDKFTQADESTTRKFGGTGLGLTICKSLVELMNGTISVESEVGAYTAFSIILPLKKHCLLDTPIEQPLQKRSTFTVDSLDNVKFTKARILLCEDNEMNQNLCIKFLQKFDATADIAENGLVAIDRFSKNDYDLILMDLQMPELDGISASKRIRNLEVEKDLPHTPIIAITANVFEEDKLACRNAGMDGFLSKPVSLNDFKETLHAFLPEEVQEFTNTEPLDKSNASKESANKSTDSDNETSSRESEPKQENISSSVDFETGISYSGGKENYIKMIGIFIDDTPALVEKIFSTANAQQHVESTRHAHTLKSMAGIIGASELNKLCFNAEHSQDCAELLNIYPTIKEESEIVIKDLSQYINPAEPKLYEAPTTPSKNPIDKSVGIDNSGCEENFMDMLDIFQNEAEITVQSIDFESLNGDAKATFIQVKTLKNMANIIGAMTLYNICLEAEGSKDCAVIQQILPIMNEEVDNVLKSIDSIKT